MPSSVEEVTFKNKNIYGLLTLRELSVYASEMIGPVRKKINDVTDVSKESKNTSTTSDTLQI